MPPYRRRNLAANSRPPPDRSRHPFPRPPPPGLAGQTRRPGATDPADILPAVLHPRCPAGSPRRKPPSGRRRGAKPTPGPAAVSWPANCVPCRRVGRG